MQKSVLDTENLRFIPEGSADDVIVLTVEEVESLRLCDLSRWTRHGGGTDEHIEGNAPEDTLLAHKKTAEALCLGREIP